MPQHQFDSQTMDVVKRTLFYLYDFATFVDYLQEEMRGQRIWKFNRKNIVQSEEQILVDFEFISLEKIFAQ